MNLVKLMEMFKEKSCSATHHPIFNRELFWL